MYKLITIDIDGTLLNDRRELTEEVRSAIYAAKAKGVKIVLCSGRAIGGVQRYLEELHLNDEEDYVITCNGALIQSSNTNKIVLSHTLGFEDLTFLYQLSMELNTSMHFFDYTKLYTLNENIHKYTVAESYITQIPLRYRRLEEIPGDILLTKILFVDDPGHLNNVVAAIPMSLQEKYAMVRTEPYFYEFLHPEVSKGNAVKDLAKILGIQRQEIMSIGDNRNDLTMIEYAGCGVAMGNAVPELKQIANYQTLSNNDNGVAHAIRKFVLGN